MAGKVLYSSYNDNPVLVLLSREVKKLAQSLKIVLRKGHPPIYF